MLKFFLWITFIFGVYLFFTDGGLLASRECTVNNPYHYVPCRLNFLFGVFWTAAHWWSMIACFMGGAVVANELSKLNQKREQGKSGE